MISLLYFFAKIIAITLDLVSLAMVVRIFLPLFIDAEESRVYLFLAYITEPFIIPVRFLLSKFNILQNSPFDWSFTISYMVIVFLRLVLPVV